MTAVAILQELRARHVRLAARDGGLSYECPRGALTPELRALAGKHRKALIALLRPPPAQCSDCKALASVMVQMEPGVDGRPWFLCSRCWRDDMPESRLVRGSE